VLSALGTALQGVDMVLCGARSGGGDGSGLLPYQLAEQLGAALLPDVLDLSKSDRQWQAVQALPKGVRRSLQASLPLVASVNPRAATAPGWSYARLQQGKISAKPPLARLWPRWCWNLPVARARWWPPARSAAMPACRGPLPGAMARLPGWS
jgi:electron transfer flavoprotein beta subunit